MHILLIEDDQAVAETLDKGLTEQGFTVDYVGDGIQGFSAAKNGKYDAMIIDRMLPGLDGINLIRQLRAANIETPALMLTAVSEVDDRVEGLEAGCDDYLGKPFAFAELLARLNVLIKRKSPPATQTEIDISGLYLHKITRKVTREGKAIHLQPREFELLLFFAERPGEAITREMLLRDIWGLEFDPQTNVVDVHVSRLRQKLDKDFRDPLIRTIRGVGYVFGEAEA